MITVLKLQEGHEYEFRISAENALGRSDPLTSDSSIVARDPFGTPGKPGKVLFFFDCYIIKKKFLFLKNTYNNLANNCGS